MRSRAVVDTNILVSALMKPDSLPAAVIQSVRHDRLQAVVCAEIMAEYGLVLPRRRLDLPKAATSELLSLFSTQALWVHVGAKAPLPDLPDPADWPFIAAAMAADCPIITGNRRHFPARVGVRVMTAREWVDGVGQA